MPDSHLPSGRHFALTWTIPEFFGGQTSAMLHRSRAFVRLGGSPVDLLTFDPRADYPGLERQLRERGELIDGMRIVNLWDWLRVHDVSRRPDPLGDPQRLFTPMPAHQAHRSEFRDGAELIRMRHASDGDTVLQVDHYRSDGSLLLSDRRDTREMGTAGGRSLVLCDATGEPVASWGTSWSLYRWWLDRLTAGAPAFLIVDSKPMAEFLLTYRKRDRATVHAVHGSHLHVGLGPLGSLRPARKKVFQNLDSFDGVVLLTERQRRDVQLLLGRKSNLAVIPNSRSLTRNPGQAARAPELGMVLASLTRNKRVDHAIEAIRLARECGADVRLEIYGDGRERERLAAQITRAGAEGAIGLRGHDSRARERLWEASFLLFTSRSEGFGLVILEAMGAGCIPIVYDIRYGPAELITHGRNGFLVRPGSVHSLARAVQRLVRMPPDRVEGMRREARRTAEHYTDEAVMPQWSAALTAALERNRRSFPDE